MDGRPAAERELVPLRRNRDFVLLQVGQALSTVGSEASGIAYTLLVLALTGSPAKAGLAAFARREEARSGVYSYENRHLAALDREREAIFRANPAAWDFFMRQPPSYRQTCIYQVMSAKRHETRSNRLERLIEASRQGMRL